ncbi:MAG: cation-efflux pump [Candidatus Thorarchaeota archaeon]
MRTLFRQHDAREESGTGNEKRAIFISPARKAAVLSVLAALVLTTTKLGAGIYSNSLGLMSESLHSGLDLVAAGITLIAVSRSTRAPDADHQFGHGKTENFAALIEVVIIWVTCLWILNEAIVRIQTQDWPRADIVGIVVMCFSILIDYERSRMLLRTAREYDSQALEADALHFSTDMLSSFVVLVGLGFVYAGLPIADPIAAIGVVVVMVVVSARLGKRATDTLMDRAPPGITDEILKRCNGVEGVSECKRVRVRQSGNRMFVDLVVIVPEDTTLTEAHSISDRVEQALQDLCYVVDVGVHVEPGPARSTMRSYDSVSDAVRRVVESHQEVVGVHNIRIRDSRMGTDVVADLEMRTGVTLEHAHTLSHDLEEQVRQRVPDIRKVIFHLESTTERTSAEDVTQEESEVADIVRRIAAQEQGVVECHSVRLTRDAKGLCAIVECRADGRMSLGVSHDIAAIIEDAVKRNVPAISSVVVHMEPVDREIRGP